MKENKNTDNIINDEIIKLVKYQNIINELLISNTFNTSNINSINDNSIKKIRHYH